MSWIQQLSRYADHDRYKSFVASATPTNGDDGVLLTGKYLRFRVSAFLMYPKPPPARPFEAPELNLSNVTKSQDKSENSVCLIEICCTTY